MNKRPGQTRVTTEVAYCSFCARPRNLRREERQLGALVRTIVTCESCHRTLSSSVGVAAEESSPAAVPPAETAVAATPRSAPPAETATAKKPAARKTAAAGKKEPAAPKAPARARTAAPAAKPATRSATKKK